MRALFAGQGRHVHAQAAAHPPPVRRRSTRRRRRSGPVHLRSTRPRASSAPGRSRAACARCSTCWTSRVDVTDPLPSILRERESLAELGRALRRIHVPESEADYPRRPAPAGVGRGDGRAGRARPAAPGRDEQRPPPPARRVPGGLLDAFDARLPFALTAGQRAVGEEIARRPRRRAPDEPAGPGRRRRGQDVVALRAMLQVVDAGRQAALLAPTEVLAAQHARSLRALLRAAGSGR